MPQEALQTALMVWHQTIIGKAWAGLSSSPAQVPAAQRCAVTGEQGQVLL